MNNLELLKKLIKIESISPNDNGCFDVIKQQFDGLDFSFEETNYKNISNLIITNGDSKNKTFCFLGHTDVVPPGPESEWSVPPFSGEIIDNKIYGRGAADMKGGVACFISALKEFLCEYKDPSFNIMVLLNSNEEGKLENGKVDRVINEMIDKDKFIDFCLIGEPSSSKKVGDVITTRIHEVLKTGVKVSIDKEKKLIVTIKKADLAKDAADARPEVFSPGNALDAKITELDLKARRIKLSVKAAQIDEEKSLIAKFGEGATKSGATLKGIFEKAIGKKQKKEK